MGYVEMTQEREAQERRVAGDRGGDREGDEPRAAAEADVNGIWLKARPRPMRGLKTTCCL
jgi:hypothetical protein